MGSPVVVAWCGLVVAAGEVMVAGICRVDVSFHVFFLFNDFSRGFKKPECWTPLLLLLLLVWFRRVPRTTSSPDQAAVESYSTGRVLSAFRSLPFFW